MTDEWIRLVRWLEVQPWNRPGSDETGALLCAESSRDFAAKRKRAHTVAG